MKKVVSILVVAISLFGLISCAGMNASVPVNIATDIAFVMAMEKYPASKPAVVAALKEIKLILSGQLTYDALMLELLKQFGDKYRYVYLIITGYIATDKPIFEGWLNLSDAYKADVIKKIDRLLLLAGA